MSFENKGTFGPDIIISIDPDRSGNYVADGVADEVDIQRAIDEIINDGGDLLIKRGTYDIQNPIHLDKLEGLRIWGSGTAPHVGDAPTILNVPAASSGIWLEDCDGIDIGYMKIDGFHQGACPYGIRVEETADQDHQHPDGIVIHDINITNFEKCLHILNGYGSSRGNIVRNGTFWVEDVAAQHSTCIEDASHWTFQNICFAGQGDRDTYGVEILAGDDSYTERLVFLNCQFITHEDGFRMNTSGQVGMNCFLGGIFESNDNHIHLVQQPTQRKTLALVATDFVGSVTKDIKITAGQLYVDSIGCFLTDATKIDAGIRMNILGTQIQDAEWDTTQWIIGRMPIGGSTGGVNLNTGAQRWYAVRGISTANANRAPIEEVVATDGTLTHLYVELSGAPGAPASGKSYRFQIYINNIGSGLDVTLLEAETSDSITNVEMNVSEGDTISLTVIPANTPNAVYARWGCQFESTQYGT